MILKITGERGCGKTTFVNAIVNITNRELIGFRIFFEIHKVEAT
jgi:molybdopterin-guanine dinucleotide biosynthesis protein